MTAKPYEFEKLDKRLLVVRMHTGDDNEQNGFAEELVLQAGLLSSEKCAIIGDCDGSKAPVDLAICLSYAVLGFEVKHRASFSLFGDEHGKGNLNIFLAVSDAESLVEDIYKAFLVDIDGKTVDILPQAVLDVFDNACYLCESMEDAEAAAREFLAEAE